MTAYLGCDCKREKERQCVHLCVLWGVRLIDLLGQFHKIGNYTGLLHETNGFPNPPSFSLSGIYPCLFCLQIVGGYAAFLYEIGLLDEKQKKYVQKKCDECIKHIKEQNWLKAFEVSSGALRCCCP